MNIQQVKIPPWNGRNGNYSPGRIYYNGLKRGKTAVVDKIVLHWMDGTLSSTDKVFTNASRVRSAHFGVGDTTVHQYVSIKDTAYHSGKGVINSESIGIEHEGGPDHPITDACYATSSELIYMIYKQMGWSLEPSRLHLHREYMATACPGTLDPARLWNGVLDLVAAETALTATLASTTHTVTPPTLTHFDPFTVNLDPSQTYNKEVERMQQYLVARQFLTVPAGEYGYYGKRTQDAVDAFQKANGITGVSKYGYWYQKTRAAANAHLTIQPTKTT